MRTYRHATKVFLTGTVFMAMVVVNVSAGQPDQPVISVNDYPVIDGSTSAQPLGALLACRMTHTAFKWRPQFMDGTRRLYPTTDAYEPDAGLSLEYPKDRRIIVTNIHTALGAKINHFGTHDSYVHLVEGKAELIIAAREPSEDELKLARKARVKIQYIPIALDAFIFIVNTNNPVKNLSVDQIRAIYTGAITNWQQVGGPNEPIHAYQRNRNSGSQEKMEKLVMNGRKMIKARDLEMAYSMIGPFNALIHDHLGIGYTVRYYNGYMTRIPRVHSLAVNGIPPSPKDIQKKTYPFVSEVVIAWINDLPDGSPARKIRDWLLTDAGQRLVAESGYIPIRPERSDGSD